MRVLGSNGLVGAGRTDGTSWWWNQEEPGVTHTIKNGVMVETFRVVNTITNVVRDARLTRLQIKKKNAVDTRESWEVVWRHGGCREKAWKVGNSHLIRRSDLPGLFILSLNWL